MKKNQTATSNHENEKYSAPCTHQLSGKRWTCAEFRWLDDAECGLNTMATLSAFVSLDFGPQTRKIYWKSRNVIFENKRSNSPAAFDQGFGTRWLRLKFWENLNFFFAKFVLSKVKNLEIIFKLQQFRIQKCYKFFHARWKLVNRAILSHRCRIYRGVQASTEVVIARQNSRPLSSENVYADHHMTCLKKCFCREIFMSFLFDFFVVQWKLFVIRVSRSNNRFLQMMLFKAGEEGVAETVAAWRGFQSSQERLGHFQFALG